MSGPADNAAEAGSADAVDQNVSQSNMTEGQREASAELSHWKVSSDNYGDDKEDCTETTQRGIDESAYEAEAEHTASGTTAGAPRPRPESASDSRKDGSGLGHVLGGTRTSRSGKERKRRYKAGGGGHDGNQPAMSVEDLFVTISTVQVLESVGAGLHPQLWTIACPYAPNSQQCSGLVQRCSTRCPGGMSTSGGVSTIREGPRRIRDGLCPCTFSSSCASAVIALMGLKRGNIAGVFDQSLLRCTTTRFLPQSLSTCQVDSPHCVLQITARCCSGCRQLCLIALFTKKLVPVDLASTYDADLHALAATSPNVPRSSRIHYNSWYSLFAHKTSAV